MIERQFNEAVRIVHCQQFRHPFAVFRGVSARRSKGESGECDDRRGVVEQVRSRANETLGGGGEKRAGRQSGKGKERGESVGKFLKQLNRSKLLESIRELNSDQDAEEEPIEAAVWKAMGDAAETSQATWRDGVLSSRGALRT